MEQKPIKSQI